MISSKYIFLLAFFFSLNVVQAQEVPTIRIDPAQAYGGAVSEYFDNVEYIPLETIKENLFGDIHNLVITDSSFVIADNDSRAVLFFDLKGKFIRKIKSNRTVLPSVRYDAKSKIVEIGFVNKYLTGHSNKNIRIDLYSFSVSGDLIDTISLDIKNNSVFEDIYLEENVAFRVNDCSFDNGSEPKDSVIYLIDLYKNDSLCKKLIPCNQKENAGFCSFAGGMVSRQLNYSVIDGTTYAATPIEHSVYRITKDTAIKICELVFPKDIAFPKDVLQIRETRLIDSVKLVARPPGIIYSVSNIFFNNKKMFFKGNAAFYITNGGSSPYVYNFIYDTATHRTVALERMTPDSTSSYLPFFDLGRGLMMFGIMYHSGSFYSYVSSLSMFRANANTKTKNPQYPPVLQEYFATQSRKSNPVIVRMKLRE